ncbi:MAG: HD domain-containing protein [Mollicutes bacterium]|nr:HD domain-containing protein [Mollicutes bacterium]
MMNKQIYSNMKKHSTNLSKYACHDKDAIFLNKIKSDIRTPFFHDIDKILYALSYTRYMDKTQVFISKNNDHIQTRMIHVQFVSKIARTIGRALNLNEDLIEAAALGHDIGHTPFGHEGERILNKISKELKQGNFLHHINSIRVLLFLEKQGNGLNLSLQTLDAIMCHNGEMISNEYYPKPKTVDDFLYEYNESYNSLEVAKYLRPMTLEGCVVRISDVIAYIGRDIEDSIRMNLVTFEDIPKEITSVLGYTNGQIVDTIVTDIIKNSLDQNYIKMSDEVFNALTSLKTFNYENIYSKSLTQKQRDFIEEKFRCVVKGLLEDLKTKNKKSSIYTDFLSNMSKAYLKTPAERIVIDYVSSMTDEAFNKEYERRNKK